MVQTFNVPGVYVRENTAGSIPASLSPHNGVYMLIHSDEVGAPTNEKTFVSSLDDFENTFGTATLSHPSVRLYFAQRPQPGINCINVAAAGAYPTAVECDTALNAALSPDDRQGFLIAPEFFLSFTDLADHTALANSMEAICADTNYYWVSLVDARLATATVTTDANAVTETTAEKTALSSPRGHQAYYFPYVVDTSDVQVPLSAAVAAIAVKRFTEDGFFQPPAGVNYPIRGIKSLTYDVGRALQGQLNPINVNCARNFPNRGFCIWGGRTVSANAYYTYVHTRIILNVLVGTLRSAFDEQLFNVVDGLGAMFSRIKGTGITICERMRVAGALFGNTPEDAYLVVCDETNNPGIDLESGIVNLDVSVRPSPLLEFLNIGVFRVSLTEDLTEVVESGESTDNQDSEVEV